MPNLKSWIEAQLKRGKKEELKDYLDRTGYAHQKLAQAAKVDSIPRNKIHSKTFVWIILLIGVVFVVWLIGTMPFFSKEQETSENVIPSEQNSAEVTEKILDSETSKIILSELCGEYTDVESAVTCEEAVKFVVDQGESLETISAVVFEEGENIETGEHESFWAVIVDETYESPESEIIHDLIAIMVDTTNLEIIKRFSLG